jgi:hypothetical protein
MPGYSGTPLPKKLGIKPQFRVLLPALPKQVATELKAALTSCHKATKDSTVDFAMLFAMTQAELRKQFDSAARRLAPAGMLWVSWPKKASKVPTDLTGDEVRRIGLAAGLVDVKVCAVTEIWSGLKFVRRLKDRSPE